MEIMKYFEYLAQGASSISGISEFDLDIFSREYEAGKKNYNNGLPDEEKLKEEYQKTCKDLGKIVLDK